MILLSITHNYYLLLPSYLYYISKALHKIQQLYCFFFCFFIYLSGKTLIWTSLQKNLAQHVQMSEQELYLLFHYQLKL